jgi:hypothetical protein
MRYLLLSCMISFVEAATPKAIGTLITSDPFEIDGVRFGAAGVNSWPVFAHERIKTETSPSTIYLPGFGKLYLAPNTIVQFSLDATPPSATLLSGQLGFSLTVSSRLRISAGNQSATVNDSPGIASRIGNKVQFTKGSPTIPGTLPTLPHTLPSAGQYLPPARGKD